MSPSASSPFVARGVFPALLTPFTDDGERIDAAALRAHVAWLIDHGVHGLMPAGSTGEGPLLTLAERQQLLEIVVDAAAGRVPVLAHVGAITTRETIALVRHAQSCGAQAASVVTPYYFRVPDEALIAHACRVAEAAPDLPIFLYNIPQNTGNALSPAVVEAIVARCPNVVGLKDSSDDLDALVRFTMAAGGRLQVLCGSDRLLCDALQAGACGSVSGNANLFPEIVVGLFEAFARGDLAGARAYQEQLNQARAALDDGRYLSLYKRVLERRGLCGGPVRAPLPEAPDALVEQAVARLRAHHLLT